ncbi:acyl--CoA ligase [Aetokthonos hydrillicola Thurmond2011]|jgi:acyl-coenzyme A synthetase/AMP-(fatty) acid ligase|uniref:Acyl--CoA ligase n=1 Tax=Aetokthonos hydrillicola Thurmond2011 TaxID=2712845 RepID=A0AAP5I7T2_9CYAN|nr:class I adenylate-forming enzyme family protein [Aetokthonos hydrillicola]MBO3460026.1 acyl--CoA ligase [Aetokthonos hydrillicola CCALA 1050]MBW4584623.1 acyl--CoA ligase [Aetokthonos hydrillicola CCALA 1050]MDR9895167.1 acyl--CoA ligase [Aetokthonos hydrillicola Thurmond2011]
MTTKNTILPLYKRIQLFFNKKLGCGNFLNFAVANNPYRDNDIFFLEQPFKTFTGDTINSFSLSLLKNVVDKYASWYYESGICENDPVAIYLEDGIGYFIHYLALNNIGAIPVLVNGLMQYEIAADFIRRVGAIALYTDEKHLNNISEHVKDNILLKFITTDAQNSLAQNQHGNMKLPRWYPYSPTDSHPIMLSHSSGTTGNPKAVIFQHKQFFIGKRIRLLKFPASRFDKFLFALPSSHSAGISYFMTSTLLGLPTMVLSNVSGHNAINYLRKFNPSLVAAFPQTYAEIASEPLEEGEFSSVKMWFNTGDAAHEAHIKALVTAGNPKSVFIDGLGASELGMALFNKVSSRQTTLFGRYMGKPRSFVKPVVLDEQGNILGPHEVGLLGIKSPTITPGYWNDSNKTLKSYKQGYWTSGDLAYTDKNGNFYHLDRSVDAIECSSGMVYSLLVEEVILKQNTEVADCAVIGVPNKHGKSSLIALVKMKSEKNIKASILLDAINKDISDLTAEKLTSLLIVREFPVGPTGKVLKRKLREEYKNFLLDSETELRSHKYEDLAYFEN